MEMFMCGCGRISRALRLVPGSQKQGKNLAVLVRKCPLSSSQPRSTPHRALSSVLYANHYEQGSQAIVELDLNLVDQFNDIRELFENVRSRKLGDKINVYHLASMHKTLLEVGKRKSELEEERRKIAATISFIVKQKQTDVLVQERAYLMERGKALRNDLKDVNQNYYKLEDEVITYGLQLPSKLHSSTPMRSDETVREMGSLKTDTTRKSVGHLLIGRKTGTIFKKNIGPHKYYLRKDAASLEQDIAYGVSRLLRSLRFTQIACPDLVKTIAIEGTGLDVEHPNHIYKLQNRDHGELEPGDSVSNRNMHLVGASPQAFAAAITRQNVREDCLPLELFSVQRSYTSSRVDRDMGLFQSPQNNVVEMFGAAKDVAQADVLYQSFQDVVWDLYRIFQDHMPVRMVRRAPPQLLLPESARVDIEIWSYDLGVFIKVASVATWSDFLSRRLMAKWSPDPNQVLPGHFLHTVHATAMNITVMVALLMEAYQSPKGHFNIPKNLLQGWIR